MLDWNADAIALYDAVGGQPLTEWIGYRVSGPELIGAGPLGGRCQPLNRAAAEQQNQDRYRREGHRRRIDPLVRSHPDVPTHRQQQHLGADRCRGPTVGPSTAPRPRPAAPRRSSRNQAAAFPQPLTTMCRSEPARPRRTNTTARRRRSPCNPTSLAARATGRWNRSAYSALGLRGRLLHHRGGDPVGVAEALRVDGDQRRPGHLGRWWRTGWKHNAIVVGVEHLQRERKIGHALIPNRPAARWRSPSADLASMPLG